MLTVLNSEFQKNRSRSTSVKLPSPTNSPRPVSRCQSKSETKNVYPSGKSPTTPKRTKKGAMYR